MSIVFANIYLFIMAVVLAILEIQIEGKHGWAKNLPTWRPKPSNRFAKIYSQFMSGKELTGYHASMMTFVILIFHLPYVFGLPLNLENEIKTVVLIFFFMCFWDFYWFVLNPFYPLKKFKKEYLSFHHPKWFLGLPTDYWGGIFTSFLIILPGTIFFHLNDLYSWWLINFGLFMIESILLILFSLYVLKIDNWHPEAVNSH